MRNKPILVALLLLSLVCNVGFALQGGVRAQQYEYKIEYNINEKKLNALASQGWELVAVTSATTSGVSVTENAYLRRAKQ